MKYTKFFNSNPSVSGNNAMSNIEALAKFDTWLAGQKIINISVGESQDTYTPLTFTKENGETYTVNIPTVKGATGEKGEQGEQGEQGERGLRGETGLEALSIISVYESATIPVVNEGVTLNVDDFNRTPTTNEKTVMFVVTNDGGDIAKAYITDVTINSISDTTVNCMYNSVNEISTQSIINNFNYMGEWVSNNEYHKNDCVYIYKKEHYTELAKYYICIEDISNSTTKPDKDGAHWAIISTNASNYKYSSMLYNKKNIEIETNGSLPIGNNNYIHFVTLKMTQTSNVVNTFCITNSINKPTIDDFKNFLSVVSQDRYHCIMASGVNFMHISPSEGYHSDKAEAIISGIYNGSEQEIGIRLYYLDS